MAVDVSKAIGYTILKPGEEPPPPTPARRRRPPQLIG